MTSAMNRLSYDVNTYQFELAQSTGPGSYVLGTPVPHCQPCFQSDARVQNGRTGASECAGRSLVDVNSELMGITRRATGCPTGKYLPWRDKACPGDALRHYPDCLDRRVASEDTRLDNPPCTLRATGWNRFEWLCKDPQDTALVPFDNFVANRIVVKDNHRPFLQRPLDQTAVLPPARDTRGQGAIEPTWATGCTREDTFDEPPNLSFRTCDEIALIQHGCGGAARAAT